MTSTDDDAAAISQQFRLLLIFDVVMQRCHEQEAINQANVIE